MEKKKNCPKHNKMECIECIELYGFYIDNAEEFEACIEHEDKKRFQFKTSPKDCDKCKHIDIRLVLN